MTVTVFLVGLSLVFHGSLIKEYKYREMEMALKEFVGYQIAYAQEKKTETGRSRFDETAQDVYFKSFPNTRVEYSPDGNHFTVVIIVFGIWDSSEPYEMAEGNEIFGTGSGRL